MYSSTDGLINITIASDISSVVFQPADWSLISISPSKPKTVNIATNLFNMPTSRHISLVVNRNKKHEMVNAIANVAVFGQTAEWKYLDSVSISYAKSASCSSSSFLPLCEQGVIYYKGSTPQVSSTMWAAETDYNNATNEWILLNQAKENEFIKKTTCKKFSWELQLILMSMCGTLEYSRFIYGVPVDSITLMEARSIYAFCVHYNLKCELFASASEDAKRFLEEILKINKQ